MHELSLARSIVRTCEAHAEGMPVVRVTVDLGALSCVMPEALEYCYGFVCKGTLLEGSVLRIERIPARARCRNCGVEAPFAGVHELCDCGGRAWDVVSGEELKVRELELGESSPNRPVAEQGRDRECV